MLSLTDRIDAMLASNKAVALFARIDTAVVKYGMNLDSGVAVGFSGGADSMLLLCYLYNRYRLLKLDATLAAIHVNHLIRGDHAYRDEHLATEICNSLGIELIVHTVDVPALAAKMGIGTEEAARNARYSCFAQIKQGREDIASVALAHNSTDNVETMLMNMLRGSGVRGMCGIPPVRDFYARPLIGISSADIRALLDKFNIPYAIDESNDTDDYTRNYVRHNILPHLSELSPSFEATVLRTSDNMRAAQDLVTSLSDSVVDACLDTHFAADNLRGLHYAVFSDAFARIVYHHTATHAESSHITAAYTLIDKNEFSISLPGEYDLVCQRGICFFNPKTKKDAPNINFALTFGENKICDTNLTVYVTDARGLKDISTNIYKFSISVAVSGDIIDSGVFLRLRADGDAYEYGGHTHRLKKVFNDRNIPPYMRSLIPIICDGEGIVWAVGLPVADRARPDADSRTLYITACFGEGVNELYPAAIHGE